MRESAMPAAPSVPRAVHLRLRREHLGEDQAEPQRLLDQLRPDQVLAGGGRVALEAAEQAQGKRNSSVGREDRMAGGEDGPQQIVVERIIELGLEIGIRDPPPSSI